MKPIEYPEQSQYSRNGKFGFGSVKTSADVRHSFNRVKADEHSADQLNGALCLVKAYSG